MQETLIRVMAVAASRSSTAALVPYAIVTARNLIAGRGARHERDAATSTS